MKSAFIVAIVATIVGASLSAAYLVGNPGEPATTSSLATTYRGSVVYGETIFIHVVSSASGAPISNESVTAGPASSSNDITYSFGSTGATLNECVHEVGNGAVVQQNGNVVSNGTTTTIAPCPLEHYDTNATGWVTISNQNASYFFVFVGKVLNEHGSNVQIVAMQGSRTYVTVTFPEAKFTVSNRD